jgi:cobalt-zinc-cadmium efflux system outer membrane protein
LFTVLIAATAAQAVTPPVRVMTVQDAMAIAAQRSRDLIAARIGVDAAQVDRIAARLYANPQLQYSFANIVLGKANPQGSLNLNPSAFGQGIQTIGITQVIDLWQKRGLRTVAADRGIDQAKLLVEDALREVMYAVRSGFEDVVREQDEYQLAVEIQKRYDETVRLSRARYRAGDISENDFKKIELEGLKYQNGVIDGQMQLEVARGKLLQLIGLPQDAGMPAAEPGQRPERASLDLALLEQRALAERPDLQAVRQGRRKADAQVRVSEREAMPDPTLGVAYTHDEFTVSGDNPNTLALSLALPIPLFDRNQVGIARARVDLRRADNDEQRLLLEVQQQVAEAARKAQRSRTLLGVFEEGGMLDRADSALKVAEKSYKAGAISLLELLEAQRTYIETRADYVRTVYEYRQSAVDVGHAVGGTKW